MRRLTLLLGTILLSGLFLIAGVQSRSHAQAPVGDTLVCFRRGVDVYCVERSLPSDGDVTQRLEAALEALVAGPTIEEQATGVWSAIPGGSRLVQLSVEGSRASVYLDLPEEFLTQEFNPLLSDQIVEQIVKTTQPFRAELMAAAGIPEGSPDNRLIIHVLAQDPAAPDGTFRDLSAFLHEPPPTHKPEEREGILRAAALQTDKTGFLAGKAVYVSAGHGWYWNAATEEWLTQRPVWENLVEDFNNAEVVNQYLLPYLYNAGAEVWTVRERDLITDELTVSVLSPSYVEVGTWVTATESVTSTFPWHDYVRYASVDATATATATWPFTPAQTANYAVYVWYSSGADLDPPAPDAHYIVAHAGGASERRVDQTAHGFTWRYLGTYPFYAGQPASVSLVNDSTTPGRVVSAGAVRVGGGMGSELGGFFTLSPSPSGRPRWEEASRYWAKFQGAPPSVYAPVSPLWGGDWDRYDDVTARPRYAEWEKPTGEDAVFVSWHTNGSVNHNMRGTESYIYDGTAGGIWTPGSDLLQYLIHSTLVEDIRTGWDPDWVDQGMLADNFGEVRLLSTMPGVLMEIAFHDDPDDTRALLDPRFAQLSARAIYRGIVRYFAYRDVVDPVFLPEPPKGLVVRNSGPGAVTLTWLPPATTYGDAATSYRVYTSPDGFAWDNGVTVTSTTLSLTSLTPEQLVFVRVAGVNAGGESLPSPTLGARVGTDGQAHILLVEAYGRNDGSNDVWQDDGISIADTAETGPSLRMYAHRANRQDYVIQHGFAITQPFDSVARSMLPTGIASTGAVGLYGYTIVDWMAGEESSPEESIPIDASEIALSSAEQDLLTDFLAREGSLFISGSEIGLDLVVRGYGPAFYTDTLKAIYQGSDAFKRNTQPYPNIVLASPGGLFDGLGSFTFDNGSGETYYADRVDYFLPSLEDPQAQSALVYQAGIGHAALVWDSGGCSRLVYMAFPFETINTPETRGEVMARILNFLAPCGPQQRTYIYLPIVVKETQ
ncbi:MAG: fibronectin type III domain-containing protein [Anaerolineae bacterium]